MAGGWRGGWALAAAGLLLLAVVNGADQPGECCTSPGTCTRPGTPQEMFQCDGAYATEFTSLTNLPPWEWYTRQTLGLGQSGRCTNNRFVICTTNADCTGGTCAMDPMGAREYVRNYMSCCRQCVWDMQFPSAQPIQVSFGPVKNESSELAMVPKYLKCTTFPTEFAALDTGTDAGVLNRAEFGVFMTRIPLKQARSPQFMVEQDRLDPDFIFWTADLNKDGVLSPEESLADLNKDGVLSPEEFMVLRHFITPLLLSNTGPAQDGTESLAGGPLGGLFYDTASVSV
ncbi:hypothetical protein T484DRAFT_1858355 [Baffinella frigidus]|nr:hypothetical protein T484DRAFT_1858355 [Cryptophyta sp. CCMP2293]